MQFGDTLGVIMKDSDRPMPLSELAGYMKHAREHGQGGEVPVVEMGMIVDDRRSWGRIVAYASAACVLVAVGGLVAVSASTESLVIASDADAARVAGIVSEEGGSVFSVSANEDGTYRVRVFSFRGTESLMNRLRGNGELERVERAE